ncbi:MAG TPA: cysteine-rich CWC family protein [Terriglobia bacterium]|nr:cysteine-rich CWC family protein [Terriglobia bacterium]
MECANGQRQLNCEACGASFSCCPEPVANCWCASVTIPDSVRAALKATFTECLCPACLATYALKPSSPHA